MHVRTERCGHDGDTLRRTLNLPVSCFPQILELRLDFPALDSQSGSRRMCLPVWAWMKVSPSPPPLFPVTFKLHSAHWSLRLGAGSFHCQAPLQMEKWAPRLFLACCDTAQCRVVWTEGPKERGKEGGEKETERFSPPPSSSAHPPSSSSHWPLSIVPAGTLRPLSPNHSGFHWGQRSHVTFYGHQSSGGLGGCLSGHVCPLPPSALHQHGDKGMQTHTRGVSCHVSNLSTS